MHGCILVDVENIQRKISLPTLAAASTRASGAGRTAQIDVFV